MEDILTTIVAHKREEIAAQKRIISPSEMEERAAALSQLPAPRSMKRSLDRSSSGIIAEFKRRSPSKGWIHQNADASVIPAAYTQAGASALSILTDRTFFGGSLQDLQTARQHTNLPLLRKEFIIDPYQVDEAKVAGADAILLIAACLSEEETYLLSRRAHDLGLEILLEIHAPEELDYLSCKPDMLGVNNRHLGTFVTDVDNSFRMAELLSEAIARHISLPNSSPQTGDEQQLQKNLQLQEKERLQKNVLLQDNGQLQEKDLPQENVLLQDNERLQDKAPLLVSESGISHPETIQQLRQAGFRGFLIGETFMKTPHPGETLGQFIRALNS